MGSIKAMLDACDRLAALDIGYDQRERWESSPPERRRGYAIQNGPVKRGIISA